MIMIVMAIKANRSLKRCIHQKSTDFPYLLEDASVYPYTEKKRERSDGNLDLKRKFFFCSHDA